MNILKGFPSLYLRDCGLTNTVNGRKLHLGCCTDPDGTYLILTKLAPPPPMAEVPVMPSLGDHVCMVDSDSTQKEVLNSDTERGVAFVTNENTFRYRAVSSRPCIPVCADLFSMETISPISIFRLPTSPDQAFTNLNDGLVKLLLNLPHEARV